MYEFKVKDKCDKCGEIQSVVETWPPIGSPAYVMPKTTLLPCPKCGGLKFTRVKK